MGLARGYRYVGNIESKTREKRRCAWYTARMVFNEGEWYGMQWWKSRQSDINIDLGGRMYDAISATSWGNERSNQFWKPSGSESWRADSWKPKERLNVGTSSRSSNLKTRGEGSSKFIPFSWVNSEKNVENPGCNFITWGLGWFWTFENQLSCNIYNPDTLKFV